MTAEVFTPSALVCRILSELPLEALGPGKKVLDPACGDGQFLFAVKMVKTVMFGMTEEDALNDIFGVDLVAENVEICRRRLGGGSIAIGNSLSPEERIEGQTARDRRILSLIFDREQESPFLLEGPAPPTTRETKSGNSSHHPKRPLGHNSQSAVLLRQVVQMIHVRALERASALMG
jgi:hypothetical protein